MDTTDRSSGPYSTNVPINEAVALITNSVQTPVAGYALEQVSQAVLNQLVYDGEPLYIDGEPLYSFTVA